MSPSDTTTLSVDAIRQALLRIIQSSDAGQLAEVTKRTMAIMPAPDANVDLQPGYGDDDCRASLTFSVSKTAPPPSPISMEEIFMPLLHKTPLPKLERLFSVIKRLENANGNHFDWNFIEPYYSEGTDGFICYFFIKKLMKDEA